MDIQKIVQNMTLDEKASMCSGGSYFATQPIPRLDVPALRMSDGPSGIRKQEGNQDLLGLAESVPAICYPAAVTQACTFNRELIYQMGAALGEECRAQGVHVLLAPGVNIKRSPLCGRNFEYFSEDPYVAGEMGKEYVKGIQDQGVGVSLKHFAGNNQENQRMSINAVIEERALREIYLSAFERIVKEAKPWSVMCAYNRLNGTYCCEHDWLLNQVLREEWGFDGFVVTDWSAMNHRVKALKAGLDLEMPDSAGVRDRQIAEAVRSGELDEAVVTQTVVRLLQKISMCHYDEAGFDQDAHHAIAEKVAEEGAVLLKNDQILPLDKDQKVAFIGEFARQPRYQGGGSSHVNCFKVTNALEEVPQGYQVTYAKGYCANESLPDQELQREAVALAMESDVAVLFIGLPDSYESEALDRKHLNLPENQTSLIESVAAVQPNTVVVLHNGSPIVMPWLGCVKAVLTMNMGGQAVGEATVKLLYGMANPSGKLTETYPLKLEDTSCYLDFHKSPETAEYHDGIFVGYRYYDTKRMDVLFPFGYGLSYSTFAYHDLTVSKDSIVSTEPLTVTVTVENTSDRAGQEVVQLYVKNNYTEVALPEKELRGFQKIHLEPGEKKEVRFTLDSRAFSYYDPDRQEWVVKSGTYDILVGQSSRQILCQKPLAVKSTTFRVFKVDEATTCGTISQYINSERMQEMLEQTDLHNTSIGTVDKSDKAAYEAAMKMKMAVLKNLTPHSLLSFANGQLSEDDVAELLKQLNAAQAVIYD